MNRETAKEFWPEIKAFGEGADIQWSEKSNDNWHDSDEYENFTSGYKFRIKPEPFECWLVNDEAGHTEIHYEEPTAINIGSNCVHMREVVGEPKRGKL